MSLEDLQILSLFSDDATLWGPLPEDEFGLGPDMEVSLKDGKRSSSYDSFADPLSPGQNSDISSDDPLPDWMSEKIPLTPWLGDEEDIPVADLASIPPSPGGQAVSSKTEELLSELVVDTRFPPQQPSPGEDPLADDLLALSPASSFYSESTPSDGMSLTSQPSSPLPPDVEMQALELLSSMGCIPGLSDTVFEETQMITVTLPLPAISEPETQPESKIQKPTTTKPAPSSPSKKTKSKPKLKNASPIDRKSRKRDQNKQAATRYRIKKREETAVITTELEGLEEINKSLKDKVESLSREIKYLKDLMVEVHLVKGQISSMPT